MRSPLPAAVLALSLAAGAARAGDGGPTAPVRGGDRDDVFATAVQAPPPAPAANTVVVTGQRPVAGSKGLIVAASAPSQVFEDDEQGRRIDAFINGPPPPAAEPPPCDQTPHGVVGAEVGGGRGGVGYGGYGTVVMPVMHCRGVVALSVSGVQVDGRRRGW